MVLRPGRGSPGGLALPPVLAGLAAFWPARSCLSQLPFAFALNSAAYCAYVGLVFFLSVSR